MATTYPPKVLDLSFKSLIEGSHYDRKAEYVEFDPPIEFRRQMAELSDQIYRGELGWGNAPDLFASGVPSPEKEWVVVQRNYQKYPSGGESHYASYAYWSGETLHVAQGNGRILWLEVQFYQVVRPEA